MRGAVAGGAWVAAIGGSAGATTGGAAGVKDVAIGGAATGGGTLPAGVRGTLAAMTPITCSMSPGGFDSRLPGMIESPRPTDGLRESVESSGAAEVTTSSSSSSMDPRATVAVRRFSKTSSLPAPSTTRKATPARAAVAAPPSSAHGSRIGPRGCPLRGAAAAAREAAAALEGGGRLPEVAVLEVPAPSEVFESTAASSRSSAKGAPTISAETSSEAPSPEACGGEITAGGIDDEVRGPLGARSPEGAAPRG